VATDVETNKTLAFVNSQREGRLAITENVKLRYKYQKTRGVQHNIKDGMDLSIQEGLASPMNAVEVSQKDDGRQHLILQDDHVSIRRAKVVCVIVIEKP